MSPKPEQRFGVAAETPSHSLRVPSSLISSMGGIVADYPIYLYRIKNEWST
jgi:hypothetical protein